MKKIRLKEKFHKTTKSDSNSLINSGGSSVVKEQVDSKATGGSSDLELYLAQQMAWFRHASSDKNYDDDWLDRHFLITYKLANVIQPKDEIESLLSAQMAATHELAMTFMYRANLKEQPTEHVETCIGRANKLMRTFLAQMEALNRHRGKGQQKVTVEHVTVNKGGQAVIGTIERPRGEGDSGKS